MAIDDFSTETRLPVVGYEGYFKVSSLGRVMRISPTPNGRSGVLRQAVAVKGYRRVDLSCGGWSKGFLVHRLVAAAFIGPCPNGLQVNHKNGIKDDNCASNLEYVTPLENIRHAYRELDCAATRARGEANGNAAMTEEIVRSIRTRAANGESYRAIARCIGVSHCAIRRCVKRLSWAHIE